MPGFCNLNETHHAVMLHLMIFIPECFKSNSLEQLLINFANEKIQHFCIEKLIRKMSSDDVNIQKDSNESISLNLLNIERVLSECNFFGSICLVLH